MFVAGIDVGSVAAKAAIMEQQPGAAPKLAGRAILPTGWNAAQAAQTALEQACKAASLAREDIVGIPGLSHIFPRVFGNKALGKIWKIRDNALSVCFFTQRHKYSPPYIFETGKEIRRGVDGIADIPMFERVPQIAQFSALHGG